MNAELNHACKMAASWFAVFLVATMIFGGSMALFVFTENWTWFAGVAIAGCVSELAMSRWLAADREREAIRAAEFAALIRKETIEQMKERAEELIEKEKNTYYG